MDIKRRGARGSKRYEFEYWGASYAWRRVVEREHDGRGETVSYHLFKDDHGAAVAHIVPEARDAAQVRREREAGGWVPPCEVWIGDERVLEGGGDVAE